MKPAQPMTSGPAHLTGDACPRAKIPDREIEVIRRLREVGVSYAVLMIGWQAPKSTIESICAYRRRG